MQKLHTEALNESRNGATDENREFKQLKIVYTAWDKVINRALESRGLEAFKCKTLLPEDAPEEYLGRPIRLSLRGEQLAIITNRDPEQFCNLNQIERIAPPPAIFPVEYGNELAIVSVDALTHALGITKECTAAARVALAQSQRKENASARLH